MNPDPESYVANPEARWVAWGRSAFAVAVVVVLIGLGIANVTTSVSWNHVLDKNWSVHTVLGITQLASDAADSPLTKRKTTPLLMTGIAYKF